ncbi:VOC family protein [Brachybacterium kimchii]|uniref:VOC family protein n=1 Tax=Brachybacterium kimchii TaxID=2942909 RepID=A0ABY4N264_9MICO|nr:VOC family protein [Brachybacterium kimchii]UQN28637.1 VOC family protein [Brachybacterium kimchii]
MASPAFAPYISFPGTADEAFRFYADVFGGELQISHYGAFPTEGFPFQPPQDAVAHAELHGGRITLTGGDAVGPDQPEVASDVYSFLIGLETTAEANTLIDALVSGGGRVAMPFALAPWGDHYGQVTDRFGVLWAFVVPGEHGPGASGADGAGTESGAESA